MESLYLKVAETMMTAVPQPCRCAEEQLPVAEGADVSRLVLRGSLALLMQIISVLMEILEFYKLQFY